MTLPALIDLSARWREIAAEAKACDRAKRLPINRNGKTHEQVAAEVVATGLPGWVEGWRPGWLNWGICIQDQFPIDCGMPITASLLRKCSGIRVAALSLFEPGCTLPMHDHPELADECLTFHLGLDCPEQGAALWTEGKFMAEQNGKWFVFEGGLPHYAFNCADRERVILYVEFER